MAQFEKGNPGGPGRPIGSRNKAYARYDEIMRESTEEALRSIGAKATKGDLPSARLVFGRLWPRARGQVVATGEVSVSPQPCERMQPVTAFQRSATAPCSAPPIVARKPCSIALTRLMRSSTCCCVKSSGCASSSQTAQPPLGTCGTSCPLITERSAQTAP